MKPPLAALVAALGATWVACGSAASNPSSAMNDAGSDGYVGCATDPRVVPYAPGLAAASADGRVRAIIAASDPSPPTVGMNQWTLRVEDATGAALPDATVAVAPFMPDHMHASPLAPVVAANGDGTYAVSSLYLFMPGVWRIGVTVSAVAVSPAATADFYFCVGG
jgi:hypothetical protein